MIGNSTGRAETGLLIDLEPATGLAITLDPATGRLSAGADVQLPEPGVRTVGDLAPVLAQPDAIRGRAGETAYLTYRDVRLKGDSWLEEHGLRYDLTVTLPGTIGEEFHKTAGHYHDVAEDGVSFPEIYDVVYGQAAFMLQHSASAGSHSDDVRDVRILVCQAGDRIVIPPDWGHVTVNTGMEPLVVADLVARSSRNLYRSFEAMRGAAVYLLRDRTDPANFSVVKNPAFANAMHPARLEGSFCEPLLPDKPALYSLAAAEPGRFEFLTSPVRSRSLLARVLP